MGWIPGRFLGILMRKDRCKCLDCGSAAVAFLGVVGLMMTRQSGCIVRSWVELYTPESRPACDEFRISSECRRGHGLMAVLPRTRALGGTAGIAGIAGTWLGRDFGWAAELAARGWRRCCNPASLAERAYLSWGLAGIESHAATRASNRSGKHRPSNRDMAIPSFPRVRDRLPSDMRKDKIAALPSFRLPGVDTRSAVIAPNHS
jgi:hypothetical protein